MLLNRLMLIVFILASGIFVSFFGGNVSYAIFYMTLTIPVVSLVYTFYVYMRFRIYQEMGQRIVIKGDLTSYAFTIANEDYITFRSVKVNFLHDMSIISNAESIKDYCLLPKTSEKMETKIRCNYRGEYYIGANEIEIMDFLYLFKITYPINSKLKVTVLPRVVTIGRLGIAPAQKDAKYFPCHFNSVQDAMDIETRKYQSGDSRKQIHWKVTAKKNQLFSRKYSSNPKSETIVIMDLQSIQEDDLTNIITEDQIIESTLAIANYCKDNNTKVKIYYEQDGPQKVYIRGKIDFDLFYQLCVGMRFRAGMPAYELLKESHKNALDSNFYIIITHNLTRELYTTIQQVLEEGNDLAILLMKDIIGPEEEDIVQHLKFAGIPLKQVTREEEIGEVLNS